jgi:hypothetical protein
VSSVGWLGAAAGFLALAVAGLTSGPTDGAGRVSCDGGDRLVRQRSAVRRLAVDGLVQALGTTWGLFQQYWVLAKLLVTVLAAAGPADPNGAHQLHRARGGRDGVVQARVPRSVDLARAPRRWRLLVLLVPTALSVYKPQGRTRYGWRKQRELRAP